MDGVGLYTSLSGSSSIEVSAGNKSDCYFYYYSSCTKGNSCPFRHEPAALRNETMCRYWLQGNCSKPNCIYRHMELNINRNKIPCYFENQPGGCKKLHCPFFHDNIKDQPREEDVPKKPDLILPVKDSEFEYETEESEIKKLQDSVATQLKIQRMLSQTQECPDSPAPSIVRKSFIVPLQDGESDSESISVSPVKSSVDEVRYVISNESDWEVERLREIQREESHLLGYRFASEDEEMLDDQQDPEQFNQFDSFEEDFQEEYFEEESEEEDVASHQTILRKSFQNVKENIGGFAKRVIGDTLMAARNKTIKSNPYFAENSLNKTINLQHRGGDRTEARESSKKPSVKERLWGRTGEIPNSRDSDIMRNDEQHLRVEEKDYVRKRMPIIMNEGESFKKVMQHNAERREIILNEGESFKKVMQHNVERGVILNRKQFSDEKGATVRSRVQSNFAGGIVQNKVLLNDELKPVSRDNGLGIIVKSLADIKAEKERLKWSNEQTNSNYINMPLLSYINNKVPDNVDPMEDKEVSIVIKSLAEIKKDKEKLSRSNGHAKSSCQDIPMSSINKRISDLPMSSIRKRVSDKSPEIGNVKIKTLDEIKAEKNKVPLQTRKQNNSSVNLSTKLSYSPITLNSSSLKKIKLTKEIEPKNKKSSLQPENNSSVNLSTKRSYSSITLNSSSPKKIKLTKEIKPKNKKEIEPKNKKPSPQPENNYSVYLSTKRSYSPITLNSSSPKKIKLTKEIEPENKKPSPQPEDKKLSPEFKPRKLVLKRAKAVSSNISSSAPSSICNRNQSHKGSTSSEEQIKYEETSRTNVQESPKNFTESMEKTLNSYIHTLRNAYPDLDTKNTNPDLNTSGNKSIDACEPDQSRRSQRGSTESFRRVNRVDSFIDEEELLLLDDSNIPCDEVDEEIDEDELLL